MTYGRQMSVRFRTLCILSIFVASLLARPAAAQTEDNNGSALSPEGQTILADVNQARIDNGLPPLTPSPVLTVAAQRHVDDVIANGNWGHYGSDGSNVQIRAARAGYGSSWVSENWVAVSSPDQAITWWMNDWIHRVNILTPYWDDIGVGVALAGNGYWIIVTDFGNVDGSSSPAIVDAAPVSDLAGNVQDIAVEFLPDGGLDYTIRPGDTLLGIAFRYGLDWQDVALANNLGENDLLQIGQALRLPSLGGIGGAMDTATAASVQAGKQTYSVGPGDTLFTIALRYGITWQEVAAVNGLGEFDLLHIGDELKLPASLDEEQAPPASADSNEAAQAEENPPIVFLVTSDVLRDRSSTFTAMSAPAGETYTIRRGDTLLGIALRYAVSTAALADANGIREDDLLQIGQDLTIPAATTSGPAPVPDNDPAEPAQTASLGRVHVVGAGDTVFGIALQYGLDWQAILSLNNLGEDDLLQPGQELRLP